MLTNADFQRMTDDLALVRADHEAALTVRRQNISLPEQRARVTRAGGPGRVRAAKSGESREQVVLLGPVGMDLQVDDRFNWQNLLYRISFVHPNRRVATLATAELIE